MHTNLRIESFAYRLVGGLRFIGIDAWHHDGGPGEDWNALWGRKEEFMPPLDLLAKEYGCEILAEGAMMHHCNREVDTENHYMVGRFFKAGAPVPDGYDSFDVPTDWAAYAEIFCPQFDGNTWPGYEATRDRILADGRLIPYPVNYWHCELFPDGRPQTGACRYAYLFSVR